MFRLVNGCIQVPRSTFLGLGDLYLLVLYFFVSATPQGQGHPFLSRFPRNLCHIAGASEVGRRPGPSVIMNSFLLSPSSSAYLSLCLCLFIYISLRLCLWKLVFSKVMNTPHQTSRVWCLSPNNRAVKGGFFCLPLLRTHWTIKVSTLIYFALSRRWSTQRAMLISPVQGHHYSNTPDDHNGLIVMSSALIDN